MGEMASFLMESEHEFSEDLLLNEALRVDVLGLYGLLPQGLR